MVDVAERAIADCRPKRWATPLFMYIWIAALGLIVPSIVAGEDRPTLLAVAALVAFAALYVATTWLAVAYPERVAERMVALAGLATLTLAATLHFSEIWLLLFVFVSTACTVTLPGRWAIVGVVTVTAATGAVILVGSGSAGNAVGWLTGPFFGGMMNIYVQRTQRLIAELRGTREELARQAIEQERLRLARDLHDLLGHTLSVIVVKAEAVRRLAARDPELAGQQASDIEEVGRQALAEVREVVRNYRQRGLAAELADARRTLEAAGVITTIAGDDLSAPPEIDQLLAWVVREGTTNVIRHSQATRCTMEVRSRDDWARLGITDDGRGHGRNTALSHGNGLAGLAERVEMAGGRLEAGPAPRRGFRLAVSVPLNGTPGAELE